MKWQKLGVVYRPDGRTSWMRTHAYLPTAIVIGNRIRVFAAFRDAENVGRMGWVDFSTGGDFRVTGVSDQPCLDVGRPGAFDDNGVSPLAIVRIGNQLRCYYAGWQLTPRVRYLLFTGAASSTDEGVTFVRDAEVPVFERSSKELIVRSGTFVLNHNGVWKAWYAAGSETIPLGQTGAPTPTYHLAYIESKDGLTWPSEGVLSMASGPEEFGFGRSFVEEQDGLFHIWCSVRSRSHGYFIGYATSKDGISWVRRDDEGGLKPSTEGWDSEMVAFPSIVDTPAGRFMFYNGNDYGYTGIGVARLEKA
jgi:hypothetical protein